jgi:hypothetical protein
MGGLKEQAHMYWVTYGRSIQAQWFLCEGWSGSQRPWPLYKTCSSFQNQRLTLTFISNPSW